MSVIPREMIEERALQIAREAGRGDRPNDVDYARAEDCLTAEFEARSPKMPDLDAPDETTGAANPGDNPSPPPH